ncbi:MAG: hypothetical protein KDI51_15790 [Xanthomonadales bacterium]|nr:hypothetical protein [Xanthomonadales bacterium]
MGTPTRSVNASRLLVVAVATLIVLCAWIPQIQALADEQVDAGLERALISFASARALNGLISVLQGTELSMQPLGVGLTLTVGQALDPVNDLVEQFSTLMLYASVAFGIQKALMAIGGNWVMSLIVSMTAVLWAGLYLRQQAPPWLSRALLAMLLIRFAIPAVTLGTDFLYQRLLADDYVQHQQSITSVSEVVRKSTPVLPAGGTAIASPIGAERTPDARSVADSSAAASTAEKGWFDRMKERVTSAADGPEVPSAADEMRSEGTEKSLVERIKSRIAGAVSVPDFDAIRAAVSGLPERIIALMVIFLLQTMIVPLVLLWALYRVALTLSRQR